MPGGAILLAAGYGRRFGSDKRRHTLPDGTPLLLASLRLYRRSFPEVVVVLRPEDRDLAGLVEDEPDGGDASAGRPLEPVRVVFCPEARHGMGHSLACGARAVPHWSYLFVALADMAWVRPDTLERLTAAMTAAPADAVVQPVVRGLPGHPVGFGADLHPRLAGLKGDQGARSLVRDAGEALVRIEVDDEGVLQDLDVPPGSNGTT